MTKTNKDNKAEESLTSVKNATNTNMRDAKKNKNDEFYTQLVDIEKELAHHREFLKGKVVLCNCDDPEWSNFWKYFTLNFKHLGLKKVISTHYAKGTPSYKLEFGMDGNTVKTPLSGDGDFRSDECVAILKEADVVVTNPPFSLFREYVELLENHNKSFLIIGNVVAATCKEIFVMFKQNRLWLGQSIHSGDREFQVPKHYPLEASGTRVDKNGNKFIRVKGVRWLTNMDYAKRHEDLILYKTYQGNESDYPKYENYDAINVDKVVNIPCDYDGAMGVPVTFLDKFNPEQFEIVGIDRALTEAAGKKSRFKINGKELFARIVIKKINK